MKNAFTNTILAAAALAISATAARAEHATKLKAEIPFAFRIGSHVYEAGSYVASLVSTNAGAKFLQLANIETGNGGFASVIAPITPKSNASASAETRLVFQCADSDCALSQVWMRATEPGALLNTPKPKANQNMHIATIRLLPTSAD